MLEEVFLEIDLDIVIQEIKFQWGAGMHLQEWR
jgi:hypothetical protein